MIDLPSLVGVSEIRYVIQLDIMKWDKSYYVLNGIAVFTVMWIIKSQGWRT